MKASPQPIVIVILIPKYYLSDEYGYRFGAAASSEKLNLSSGAKRPCGALFSAKPGAAERVWTLWFSGCSLTTRMLQTRKQQRSSDLSQFGGVGSRLFWDCKVLVGLSPAQDIMVSHWPAYPSCTPDLAVVIFLQWPVLPGCAQYFHLQRE